MDRRGFLKRLIAGALAPFAATKMAASEPVSCEASFVLAPGFAHPTTCTMPDPKCRMWTFPETVASWDHRADIAFAMKKLDQSAAVLKSASERLNKTVPRRS